MPRITNEEIAAAIERFRETLSNEILEEDLKRFAEADEEAAYLYVNRILSTSSASDRDAYVREAPARKTLVNNAVAIRWVADRQEAIGRRDFETESFKIRRTQIKALL